jgi:hypothetical protein
MSWNYVLCFPGQRWLTSERLLFIASMCMSQRAFAEVTYNTPAASPQFAALKVITGVWPGLGGNACIQRFE